MEIKDPIARLREIAVTLDDAAASMSEHGFSFPGIKAKSIADEIEDQYMKLPVDTDGVPIKPGDRLVHGPETIVAAFVADDYICTPYGIQVPSLACRLVKPDPVAEELAKFLSACGDDDPHYYDEQIAEFAERIRKAVER